MTMRDRKGKSLKKGDRVKYVGPGILTLTPNSRPNVARGDQGRVEGGFSASMIWVKLDKGGDRIQISQSSLEKL